ITQEEWQRYDTYFDKMIERNKKMIDQMQ
ncbi:TPA: lipoate--protein ligase family protein, partial [Staphylococcus aureus]|nr:lipoate--protein ligase family protein [Staphylococcus aureus]HEH2799700.1 lipoate--protein ligase family protein [Staphylococcus aureus]